MKESEQHKTTKKINVKRMKVRKTIVYSLSMSSRHRYDYIGRFYEGIFALIALHSLMDSIKVKNLIILNQNCRL